MLRFLRKRAVEKDEAAGIQSVRRALRRRGTMDCLERNEKDGIVYHRDGITGDYDGFDDMETLIRFIREGKKP